MKSEPSATGVLVKSAFIVLALWLAYQSLSPRDFAAPSTVTGTAPVLR